MRKSFFTGVCLAVLWSGVLGLKAATLVDQSAPMLKKVFPLEGQRLRTFSVVEVLFSEPITGLDADDLLVNGMPAVAVQGAGAGPYVFHFPTQTSGTQRLTWRDDHGIEDLSSEPNAFQTAEWTYEVEPEVRYEGIEITEILAANQSGLTDDDRDTVDWIELHNTTDQAVDLSGWSLTDDPDMPGQWVFDGQTIQPNAYFIVYASAKDRPNRRTGDSPHTNFKLSRAGEFLGLFSPELPRQRVSDLGDRYPEQRNDHSYGRRPDGAWSYFERPTPGRENDDSLISEIMPEPHFSAARGFYDRTTQLVLSTSVEGAVVRYTLDQSEPTMRNGLTYQSPIELSRTSTVRAAVLKPGFLPSKTVTHSYLFRMSRSRRALPILSLVTDEDHLTGRQGIMETNPRNTTKRGRAWERPVSVEYFLPDGSSGFQIDCGLRIQGGNYVRERYDPNAGLPFRKYSFRLYFRGDYGETALNYPLIPRSPADAYKQLVLRAGMNDHSNPFVVDELVRRLSADMGQVSSQGTLVHLYINGIYKGYYNPTERIDEDFLDSWQGGKGEYDIIAQFGEVRSGNTIQWNRLKEAMNRDLSLPSYYLQAGQLLDLDNFIDYLILNIYVGTRDWPHNNWRAARERVDGAKWKFYVWDAEWAFFNQGGDVRHNTLATELSVNQDIAQFYQSLAKNSDFRVRFADRVQLHFFGDGALTDPHILKRFEELRNEMAGVVRISDTIATTWIPQRRNIIMEHLANEGLFLTENVPQFSVKPGSVQTSHVSLSSDGGEIYYTLDGSDPLLPESASSNRTPLVAERTSKFAFVPVDGTVRSAWRSDTVNFDDSDWVRGRGGVGYDRAQTYREHIGIDVNDAMNGKNTSVYVRIPFNVRLRDVENHNLMNLLVKYDDGFVAYLNGRRIAEANAPGSVRWNSAASGDHADSAAVQFQSFKVTDRMNLLKDGVNLLALQGLNVQLSSSDFLLDALLEVGVLESGKPAPNAELYGEPIRVQDVTDIRARSFMNGRWSALSQGVFFSGQLTPSLKFTEIMYHPPGGDAFEFVELTNFGPVAYDLSRHALKGLSFEFAPETQLGSGDSLLLASNENPGAFQQRYPSVEVDGYFGGALSNRGEWLIVENSVGNYVTGVDYGDQGVWSEAADGAGYSLELGHAVDDPSMASSWWRSQQSGGSPGLYESREKVHRLVVSEVVAAPVGSSDALEVPFDWIELENRGDTEVKLDGYRLMDATGRSAFVFQGGVVLQPDQRWVIWQSVSSGNVAGFSFGLDRDGDSVVLLDAGGNRVDAVSFGRQLPGYSLIQDGTGSWVLGQPTPGESNLPATTAPLSVLRINELLANPLPGENDWLEVLNTHSDLPVDLTGLHFQFNDHTVRGTPYAFVGPRGFALFESSSSKLQGSLRFRLPSDGGTLALLDDRGDTVDEVVFESQQEGISYGRVPDGNGRLQVISGNPSPGASNQRPIRPTLLINELLAQNRSTRYEGVEGTPDWIELVNVASEPVSLDGIKLHIDGLDTWTFPDGAQLEGRDYLVVWADGDDLVARRPFKGFVVPRSLKASGGEVALLNAQGLVLDRIVYGIQIPDASIGRTDDHWGLLAHSTPGEVNAPPAALGNVDLLRLNEWRDRGEGDDWLEIYHAGAFPVSLGGLFLTDDPSLYGKTKHEIAALSFMAPHSWMTFQADHNVDQGADHLSFNLSSQGETLRLYDSDLSLIDEVLVVGSSMLSGSYGRLPDGADPITFFDEREMSSGRPNLKTAQGLRINESLLTPLPPLERAIEVFNDGEMAVDLSGWAIGSAQTSLDAFRIAPGVLVQPKQFRVLHESAWLPSGFQHSDAWIPNPSDILYLTELNAQGLPTGRRFSFPLTRTLPGQSMGMIETSMGMLSGRLEVPSFGASTAESLAVFQQGMGEENALPWLGDVVISELLVQAEETDSEWGPLLGDVEYVELFNRSDQAVLLSSYADAATAWRIRGGMDFDFEGDLGVESGQILLLVNFDPFEEVSKLEAMKQAWSLPDEVQVVGPFSNRLGNDRDQIRLQYLVSLPVPLLGGLNELQWLDADRVDYTLQEPWPLRPRQAGSFALTRENMNGFGNEPNNWYYAHPNPGFDSSYREPVVHRLIQAISVLEGDIVLHIATEKGVSYQIQYTHDLSVNEWVDLERIMGSGDKISVEDGMTTFEARFYRVVIVP